MDHVTAWPATDQCRGRPDVFLVSTLEPVVAVLCSVLFLEIPFGGEHLWWLPHSRGIGGYVRFAEKGLLNRYPGWTILRRCGTWRPDQSKDRRIAVQGGNHDISSGAAPLR
ncbi:MAG: hypothetical protein GXY42_10960 [Desulfovibrionales bacterium]|nr:hypothetical protein [Desulfovibrionales bacterium]